MDVKHSVLRQQKKSTYCGITAGLSCDGDPVSVTAASQPSILTLSDHEKAEIRAGGASAREVLERAESLPPEHILKLHGAARGLRGTVPESRQGDRARFFGADEVERVA
jgi:hypothetical protein